LKGSGIDELQEIAAKANQNPFSPDLDPEDDMTLVEGISHSLRKEDHLIRVPWAVTSLE